MVFWQRVHLEELADAMRGRRDRAGGRCISAILLSFIYLPILPWSLCLGWFAVYCGLAGLEWLVHHWRWLRRPDSVASILASLGSISVQSLALGWLGFEVMERGMLLGPAIGTAHLLGGMLIHTMASRRSVLAFWSGVAPQMILMVGAGAHLVGARAPFAELATLVGCYVLLVALAATLWREHAGLSRSEAAARSAAQSASAAKSSFIATVSHELRTPISAIQAGAVELERGANEPAQRRRAALVLDAARMMRTLLDDLLDLSKVEAGRMGVEAIPFDARRIVVDTLRFWQAEARNKGVQLGAQGGRQIPQWITGDPTRLRQVLNNLLSNAIKFTDHGAVKLMFSRDGSVMRFSIQDTGIGMSEVQLVRLFTPFGQADDSVVRTHGGTGLGLALSRDLARLMGGDVTVESAPGIGSRFTLSLPLRPAEPPVGGCHDGPAAAELPPLRILAVDDHEINRRAMGILLETMGLVPAFAIDGADALRVLAREPYDVVLMDVHMPEVDGLEVTRRVRAQVGPNRTTPIVAVTGASEPRDRARCLDAGMTDCIGKPIEPLELYEALERVLQAPDAAAHSVVAA